MTRRFTETDKWQDDWFLELPFEAKLLFLYLCDACDCAGFWEVNYEHASRKTGLPLRGGGLLHGPQLMTVEDAMGELAAKLIWREDGCVVYVKNFLKHQGNWPLDRIKNVPYGKGIIQRFDVQGEFGNHVCRVLTDEPQGTKVSDLIYGSDNPLRKPKARLTRDLTKSPSNGNSNKGGPGGNHECAKDHTGECSGPGVYRHVFQGRDYWLCETHQAERVAYAQQKQQ
jgi:hypothetical protein